MPDALEAIEMCVYTYIRIDTHVNNTKICLWPALLRGQEIALSLE